MVFDADSARRRRSPSAVATAAALLTAFLAAGALGAYRYVDNFWLYRGYAAPKEPSYVSQPGTQQTIGVTSPALGGRTQQVVVYLPSGYSQNPQRRYPVLYLLHGFPGRPLAFIETVQLGVIDDALTARGRIGGVILVAPMGSTGTFTDKEWANGVRPNEGWETFVAHDVVRAIDARYRTIANAGGRAIAGLSEGGYGSLNIGLHHPDTFRVLESWSGYQLADKIPSIFDRSAARLAYNSPAVYLPRVAPALLRHRVYVWFYTGTTDSLRAQNRAFAAELTHYRVPHTFFVASGGHTWRIWRGNAERALLAAADRMSGWQGR